jgi:ABC-type sugar transport system substrate-binding protein
MRFESLRWARLVAVVVAMFALALTAAACGSDDDDAGGGTTGAPATTGGESADSGGSGSLEGDGKELVLFTMTASNVYGANQIAGAQEMADKLGYELKVFQNNFSQPEQDQQVQQYVATGAKPAAALIFPWIADAAVNSIRQLSTIAPVIMITQEPNEQTSEYVKAYAGANQQLIGRVAGEMMMQARDEAEQEGKKFASPEGNLLVFQHPEGEKTGTERWIGFEEATADKPFNVIGTEYGANDPETGYEKGSQVIPRFKDEGIDFIYVSNQQAANGIIRALKENDIRPGKDVKIVSSDCSGSLEAVENGETFGTGLQSGAIEGQLGVATAAQYIATEKVEGETQQYESTPEPPEFEATPPAALNYMPHAAAVGPEGIKEGSIWGYSAEEICAGG